MISYDAHIIITLTLPEFGALVAVCSGVGWTWRDFYRALASRSSSLKLNSPVEQKRVR